MKSSEPIMTKPASPKGVKFSNLEKVFFPKSGFTKGDLIRHYLDVVPWLLPHLRGRPVTLVRFPDGITGEKFYEKNAPKFRPDWIKTAAVPRVRHAGSIDYLVIDDAPTLAWCANLAAIELHPFLHQIKALDRPTCVALDLDPGEGADLLTCARVAFLVKEVLDGLGLAAFPKVSGSKGLQIYIPLNSPRVNYDATSAFAKAMAELLERQHPKLVVSKMARALRGGRVFIDWSQNTRSKTTVAVYSLRAKRADPFVSMPVTWPELQRALRAKKTSALNFGPAAALQRLKKQGDLFAPVLALKQKLPSAFSSQAVKSAAGTLTSYAAKRDFKKTKEPAPGRAKEKGGAKANTAGRFVVQKHAASRLHYDFRLEMDGALKSWAVPKGISTERGVKHAAFEVEDHPLDYLRFEGTIPKGQYGGGTVMVWDIGTFELLGGSYGQGDLKLRLKGKKLKGEWHLFRIRSDEAKPVWLIVKANEDAAPISTRRDDSSALTHRSMARIAKDNNAQWQGKTR